MTIPTTATGGLGRPRRHHLPGFVVAAASLSRRLVAVVHRGDELRCVVVGKELGRVSQIAVAVDDVGGLPGDAQLLSELAPVHYSARDLLVRLGDEWWRLRPDRAPERDEAVAVGVGRALDTPTRVRVDERRRLHDGSPEPIGYDVVAGALRVVVAAQATAWSVDERWHVRGRHVRPVTIEVDDACEVIGLLVENPDDPALVTRSRAGALIRAQSATATRTLTRWSGTATAHAVHPALPLIAVQRDERTVEVGDLVTGDLLATVRSE